MVCLKMIYKKLSFWNYCRIKYHINKKQILTHKQKATYTDHPTITHRNVENSKQIASKPDITHTKRSNKIPSDHKENSSSITAEDRTNCRVIGAGASARGGDCFDARRRSTSVDRTKRQLRSMWLSYLL
ncbi:hypothetical protein B5X24_HaOG208052 [Helicoverpa armigera]|nr:hypothetical protein B5X24_HaOG208052 [Helicoverpa armigera]